MEISVIVVVALVCGYIAFKMASKAALKRRIVKAAELLMELEKSDHRKTSYRASLLLERLYRNKLLGHPGEYGGGLGLWLPTRIFVDIEGEVIALWKTEQRFKNPDTRPEQQLKEPPKPA